MTPNTIFCGDSSKLLANWEAGWADLVFADPPFNIGYVYDAYHDNVADDQYIGWTRDWMAACQRALKPNGSMYIAIGAEFAADVRVLGRQLGLTLRNWIIWHYSFGQQTKKKFARAHTHIFYFSKNAKQFTFNDHMVRFPSARHTEYQDLRANPEGRLPDDVWDDFPRVCGTFKEREGFHGCQMPEALLMRIILASSNAGEIVLDPFVGSGTTAVAAQRLGRKYVGIDLSPDYVEHVRGRLDRVATQDAVERAAGVTWPSLHDEMLAQLYRETKVTLDNLLPNAVAIEVIAKSLSKRTGADFSPAQIHARLVELRAELRLPKLPNDTSFRARDHVTTEGKVYTRKTLRWRSRKATETVDTIEAAQGRLAI